MNLRLGQTGSGEPVVLRDAENPHAFASGRSGSGKSFFFRLLQLQAVAQGTLCLVLDYTGDFREYHPPDGLPVKRIDVASPAFGINPLSAATGQTANVRAQQLVELVRSVYRMGSRATTALLRTVLAYLAEDADEPMLNGLLAHVQAINRPGAGLIAALEPLELLNSLIHSGPAPISLDLTAPGLVVLDFDQIISADLRKFLVELILRAIWDQRTTGQFADAPPLVLVLDESQNLLWGQNSMAIRILREGRKYNIGGWFASQFFTNKEAIAALGQAALQAYFRPDDPHVHQLAKRFCPAGGDLKRYENLIQNLRRGQFLCTNKNGKVVKVNVKN